MSANKAVRRVDYKAPAFTTDKVELDFDIHDDHTTVTSSVTYRRTGADANAQQLVLNAKNSNRKADPENPDFEPLPYIRSVSSNGVPLEEGVDYTYDAENSELIIPFPLSQDELQLTIETTVEPQHNATLEGLYKSDSCYVTQNEAEGFRRITPFLDRPDVMATYQATIHADKEKTPVLLANGNLIASGEDEDGRHWATYEDPWPKPSYLFATANGDLDFIQDKFVTRSGQEVELKTFTEKGDSQKALHAMKALKTAMKWDEDVFDCEYDLDNFKTVALAKFGSGAMENKGLNIFRDSLILANKDIATDADFQRIIDVVGHEYFHNYSGDRVTVANWHNLSLKEGLTVCREQMFTAFTTSEATQRIGAVQLLRQRQFPEDDGPNAHPVMVDSYEAVDNIYSMTVYEKGAEVIGMMKTLMGEEAFIQGVKDYFRTNDGQAVTINEFVDAMEKASGLNLHDQFFLWYTQAGRPQVNAEATYDPEAKTYTLTLEQQTRPTKGQDIKHPFYIPVRMGLVDEDGNDMNVGLQGEDAESATTERVLHFTKSKQTFVFTNVEKEPAFHSLFRNFSAPVDCDPGLTEDQLHKQLISDPDGFNRWDTGQKLAVAEMKRLYEEYKATGTMPEVNARYLDTIRALANDNTTDPALLARALTLPGIVEVEAQLDAVDPSALAAVNEHLRNTIGQQMYHEFAALHNRNTNGGIVYSFDYKSVGQRAVKAIALDFVSRNGQGKELSSFKTLYKQADNMTDRVMNMAALNNHDCREREAVFDAFYQRYKDDGLTIRKWFSMQAARNSDDGLDKIRDISENDPVFDWKIPGHFQALFGGFAQNYAQFHRADGKGYELFADAIIKEDKLIPLVAGRGVDPLCDWEKYSEDHQKMMIAALEKIAAVPDLSANVREKVTKALPDEGTRQKLGLSGPAPN